MANALREVKALQICSRYLRSFKLGKGIPRHPDQLAQFAAASNGFGGVMTMPEGVLIADRGAASGCPAMHSTPALSVYRRRLAKLPAPGTGSASECQVHR